MTQAQQPEALRLAAICETKGMFPVADELNRMHARILELEQGKCLHQIAEPASNLTRELADMLERSITGLGHYRNTEPWSEADEEHIKECNALLDRFNSSDDEREAAPQAVQPAVPVDAEIDAAIQAFDWEGWADPQKAKRAFTREALARWAAPAHPAEGVPAQAVQPSWLHVECADPDYSGFYEWQDREDAYSRAATHNGTVTNLYTRPTQPAAQGA